MTTTPNSADALYTQQRFLFMTLDPVHIGTGGYRLGRVDMTIAREPGTNLPKIPGTSLAGAARSYAAMRYGKPEAAGQHKKFKGERTQCPIIYTFGTATDTGESNQAGTVSIGDAQILFFPVNSMIGPVWVSTVEAVEEAWGKERLSLPQGSDSKADSMIASFDWDGDLNLGWLMFPVIKGLVITPPDELKDRLEWSAIRERIALVSLKLFSQIVNSNLEVRTSVSIDPETGAAQEKALFTYEAIPRATWLWCDVVEDDYRKNGAGNYPFPVRKQYNNQTGEENKGEDFPEGEKSWKQPLDVARAGMNLIQYLGVGGMGTRGFGRMRSVADWEVLRGK